MNVATKTECRKSVASWREGIQVAGGMLVDLGVAEDRYVQACIDSLEKSGPYIVLTPGVALAHARAEEGATGVGVTLLRLDEPVEFGHPTNDPVDLVFAFCTDEPDGHVPLLRKLAVSLAKGCAQELRSASPADLDDALNEVVGNG